MSSSPDTRRRMRTVLSRIRDNDAAWQALPPPPAPIPPTATARPQASLGGRFRRLREARSERLSRLGREMTDSTDELAELHEAGERLAQLNEDLRNLVEGPIDSLQSSETGSRRTRDSTQDEEQRQGRRKRRRIDGNVLGQNCPTVNYGHYGQVVPGHLKMQLISSDGGIVDTPGFDAAQDYGAENVLRPDRSVYCTKSARCNMVFSHQGGTTFCLSKLVIKAPKYGFSNPFQEGLVFVSMRRDEIFDRTAQYQIFYFPTSQFASSSRSTTSRFGRTTSANEYSILRPERALIGRETPPVADFFDPADWGPASDEESEEENEAADSSSDESCDGHAVNPDDNGNSDSDRTLTPHASAAYRASQRAFSRPQREAPRFDQPPDRPPPRRRSPTSGDYEDMLAQLDFDEVLRRGDIATASRRSRRAAAPATPSLHSPHLLAETSFLPPPPSLAPPPAPASSSARPSIDLLTPAARFSISPPSPPSSSSPSSLGLGDIDGSAAPNAPEMRAGTSHGATIRFDPPLSGRFILLKLWSPRQGGNIDVQNISAYGFAGPRWFPKVEWR